MLNEPASSQKRSSSRIPLTKVAGRYRILGRDYSWERCEIVDLSLGGLSVIGEKSFFVGDQMQISFPLVNEEMYLQVEVTHISGRRCGVKFLIVHKNQEDIIRKFLQKHFFTGAQ